jgi:branched-chain amino acid transport system substrate-binding protein
MSMFRKFHCSRIALRASLLFCAILTSMIVGGVPRAASAAGEPIEINVILSLSGQVAFLGRAEQQSLQLLETTVNKNGGINGRPVKFVIADDQSNPQVAIQLTNALLSQNISMLLGPNFQASCLAMEPLVIKSGPVEYCFSPGIPATPGSYVYSATVSSRDDQVATVRYLRGRGWTRIGIIATTDATGQVFDSTLDAALAMPENKGLEVVAREHFSPTDISVAAQITRIKAANPQVIIAWAAGTPFATVLRAINDQALSIPIFGGNGNMNFAQLAQYSAFMPKELYFSGRRAFAPDPAAPPPVRKVQSLYFNAFRDISIQPDFFGLIPWDPALLYIDALRHLGPSPSAAQVNAYIQNLHEWAGVQGYYNFSDGSQRGIGIDGAVIDRWDPSTHAFVAVSKPGGFVK